MTVNFPRAPTAEAWTTLNKNEDQRTFNGGIVDEEVLPLGNPLAGKMSKCFNQLGILEKHQASAIALVESDSCRRILVWTACVKLVEI